MNAPSPWLAPGRYVDSAHPAVRAFAQRHGRGADPRERAVALYYAVRDGIRYNPFLDFQDEETYRASSVLARGHGFCVGKSALYAACLRALGVPARLGFADVRNHLTTPRLRERMGGSDLFVFHGYTEVELEGRWLKATPVFNRELCERFGVRPLEFDGRADSILHPFDAQGRRHMEYVADRGVYADVPVDLIRETFRATYPLAYASGADAADESFG